MKGQEFGLASVPPTIPTICRWGRAAGPRPHVNCCCCFDDNKFWSSSKFNWEESELINEMLLGGEETQSLKVFEGVCCCSWWFIKRTAAWESNAGCIIINCRPVRDWWTSPEEKSMNKFYVNSNLKLNRTCNNFLLSMTVTSSGFLVITRLLAGKQHKRKWMPNTKNETNDDGFPIAISQLQKQ